MIVMLVMRSHHAVDVIYDVRMRADVNLPSTHWRDKTEVLVLDLIGIALIVAELFQVVYRFTLSLFVGNGNGTLDILFGSGLAELAWCVARSDGVFIAGESGNIG